MIGPLLVLVVALFPISEVALALLKRSRAGSAQSDDRGSMRLLWTSIIVGNLLAVAAQMWLPSARIAASPSITQVVALALLVGGLAVRWAAILTLGRFFTVDVAIHSDHAVVQRGLYGYMRHPSYTGLLIAFAGLGLFYANTISIVGLLVPIVLGVLNRVETEERALGESLGPAYAAYAARTKRFIPWLW